MVNEKLLEALAPITVVCGHYGVGKSNFSVNLAIDLAEAGYDTTLIDLDIVNPYFRSVEQRTLLESHGVRVIASVYAEAGTSLDLPAITGAIMPALRMSHEGAYVIIDAGGDDVGATALGRFAPEIKAHDNAVIYVLNRFRNLVSDPADALENMREIELASHLNVTALASNAHMKYETTPDVVEEGIEYSKEMCRLTGLPLVSVTVPYASSAEYSIDSLLAYPVKMYIRNPWEEMPE